MVQMFRGKVQQIHFVGIGGSGMCGIAEVLRNMGFAVTGSDINEGEAVVRLRRLGAHVFVGHRREQVAGADVVVKSTAVGMDNLEVQEALERDIPVIRRAEMLAELMRLKYGIAVAGTHGKTTTTSMLATCLHRGGLDPTVVIGGRLDSLHSNAKLGEGPYLVAEADESDGTFMLLAPTIAIVTSVDAEHLEHYGSFEALESTFLDFVNKVPFYGCAVLCLDHPVVQRMLPRVRRRVVTYGTSVQSDFRCDDVRHDGMLTSFSVWRGGEHLGEVQLGMPGRHNVKNALAAIATAMELDIPFSVAAEALRGFSGVQRRFTVRGEAGGRLVVDDYGHHPVEISATLQAASWAFPDRRLVAVFQPHRYSRVKQLAGDFCRAFNQAAQVVVCPIYPAGEAPMEGVHHHGLAEGIRAHGHRGVMVADDLDHATRLLLERTRAGDLVITLGAGNVNRVCQALLEAWRG